MRIVIFGLSVSSAWGNGHAALWRALIRALLVDGHRVTFFERDVTYYALHRDLEDLPPGGALVLYPDWPTARAAARVAVAEADAALVTSYCPDAIVATQLLMDSRVPVRAFYDLDTPVTLGRLARGEPVAYLPPDGLGGFDLVLSYTGGAALDALRDELGARVVVPLYGSVDPDVHRPLSLPPDRAALSYLGTYAADRQATLEQLFIAPARARPDWQFLIAGAQYPASFPWTQNMRFLRHLPPDQHARFYGDARLTLNVTRADMARMGWCPSGRLFEAAACGVPILSDSWPGLEDFFTPGSEILLAANTAEVMAALSRDDGELAAIGRRGRQRTLATATASHRARELVAALADAANRRVAA
jgi:spore maturation protein CgeB